LSAHDNIEQFLADLERVSDDLERDVGYAMEAAGIEVVDFARSYTDEMRPGIKKKGKEREGDRKAHPGGWADISGALKNGYYSEVETTPGVVELTVGNSTPYAEELEKNDDYWVVKGLEEGKHIEEAVERNVKKILDVRRSV